MSTKLDDGLRLKDPNTSLFEASAALTREITAEFQIARLEIVARTCAEIIDLDQATRAKSNLSGDGLLLFEAESRWRARQIELGSHHGLNDPLRFNIVFGQTAAGDTLAYPFHRLPAYSRAVERTGLFEEYGYWNNTDAPGHLAKEAWQQRRADWDQITDVDETFSHLPMWSLPGSLTSVFSWHILHENVTARINELVTPDERLTRKLRNMLTERIMAYQDSDSEPFVRLGRASRQAELRLRSFKNTPEWDAVERPDPIPSLSTTLDKIKATEIPHSLVESLFATLDTTTPD